MAKFTARIYQNSIDSSKFKFSIDFPRIETLELLDNGFIAFRAWAFPTTPSAFHYVFSFDANSPISPNTTRSDVKATYPEAPALCGLHTVIPFHENFKFGIVQNGETYWLATLEFTPLPVLEGQHGYLFLSNDDNQSVAQFTGNYKIDNKHLAIWRDYFDKLNLYCQSNSVKFAFCLAPAKEYVFQDFYPFLRQGITPHDQFVSYFSEVSTIINPVEILYRERHLTYSRNDTHWTDFGAHLVARAICEKLDISHRAINLPYILKQTTGDLGVKFNPQRLEHCYFADTTKLQPTSYNNNIPVRGNILTFTNPEALQDETCLIFGSSSSASIALQLTNTYRRVVRIFSGADIDWDIVEHEKPACIIVVFASRFLVKAPSADFKIGTEILRKLRAVSSDQLLATKISGNHPQDILDQYYADQVASLIKFTH